MEEYKREFIDFMIESGVLKFGEFTLKSGRKSPFFMNIGEFCNGYELIKLSEFYAKAIYEKYGDDFDVLFGPAYKGIPLSVATSMAFYKLYGKKIRYCSNRKEIKDHGDMGILLGSPLKEGDKIVMIEDVTTTGKSMDETVPIVKANLHVKIVGLMVSLDRGERGKSEMTALKEVKQRHGFETASIVSMSEVVGYLKDKNMLNSKTLKDMQGYYEKYGVK